MSFLFILSAFLLTSFIAIQVFSLIAINTKVDAAIPDNIEWPKVSILLAARNEEKLIKRSLDHLVKLDYPSDKLEVLIGDDQSTDNTLSIVREFILEQSNFQVFSIESNLGKARGKGNVLAQLAHKATGEFYLITDVDVALPSNWVKSIISAFDEKVGIVSGTTTCERHNQFSNLQAIDWLHFMGYIKAFANVGVSCTAVGNNMGVRAKAYRECGGFEALDFSITEDYKLFEAVTRNGWDWKALCSESNLGQAWYLSDWKELLHQRKRWLMGARDLPSNWKGMLVLYALFTPALITMLFLDTQVAMVFWGIKLFIQIVFVSALVRKVNIRQFRTIDLFLYEIYLQLQMPLSILFYLLPIKSEWKGRKYNFRNIE